jgi:hypothetical protein
MRRLITYFNALLFGMILGMVFVAIVHASAADRQTKADGSRMLRLVLHHPNTRLAQ